jgi:hypothetical protein
VTGAQLADAFPAALTGVTYTSVAAGGATGNTAAGAGSIADVLTLPAGASVAYTVTATVSPTAAGVLTNTATVTAPAGVFDPDLTDNSSTDTDTILPSPPPPPPPPPPGGVAQTPFAVGMGAGGSAVDGYNPDGSPRGTADPFPGFAGGVRVATADVNGDGTPDTIAGTGPGGVTRVVVLDGTDGHELFATQPFEDAFAGGVYVSAGDLTGDGTPDLVVTPDEGGGPRVLVYDGKTFTVASNFFGIDDPNFRGGARAALADLNADGRADLVVAAGFGGGPRIAVFDGQTVTSGTPVKLFNDIFVFEQTLRNGVFVTAGDCDADGFADLVAAGGPGGGPRVYAISGKDLLTSGGQTQTPLANFFAGNPDNRGGVRVAAKNLDGDARADLVVGDGEGAGSRVTGYLGMDLAAAGTPPEQFAFDAFPGFTGGVYVG